jgi:hypothetical protein
VTWASADGAAAKARVQHHAARRTPTRRSMETRCTRMSCSSVRASGEVASEAAHGNDHSANDGVRRYQRGLESIHATYGERCGSRSPATENIEHGWLPVKKLDRAILNLSRAARRCDRQRPCGNPRRPALAAVRSEAVDRNDWNDGAFFSARTGRSDAQIAPFRPATGISKQRPAKRGRRFRCAGESLVSTHTSAVRFGAVITAVSRRVEPGPRWCYRDPAPPSFLLVAAAARRLSGRACPRPPASSAR